jgi:hypothetical protein
MSVSVATFPPFFEYIFRSDLTPLLEERTKIITDTITKSIAPFSFIKYYDDPIGDDKKVRTIVLSSSSDITSHLCITYFKDCNTQVEVYYRQRIM